MSLTKGHVLPAVIVSLCFPAALSAATRKKAPPNLTAEQIVQKHVAARGGLKAWNDIQSMLWKGKMDVGYGDSLARSMRYVSAAMKKGKGRAAPVVERRDESQKQVQLPFLIEMKRPAKSRVELDFAGKTAVQVYDGTHGWLFRPYLNRDDWEPFTAEQAKSEQDKWDLNGPVIDAAAKGTKVQFVSVESVEGRDAYKLKLTHKNGVVQHVWIDAKSFLDVKIEGTPRRMDGKMRTVWITQRNFRSVQGVKVPFVLETAVDGYPDTHKMIIDKVALNPQLDDALFMKPKA